jgi:hypothetical protein
VGFFGSGLASECNNTTPGVISKLSEGGSGSRVSPEYRLGDELGFPEGLGSEEGMVRRYARRSGAGAFVARRREGRCMSGCDGVLHLTLVSLARSGPIPGPSIALR